MLPLSEVEKLTVSDNPQDKNAKQRTYYNIQPYLHDRKSDVGIYVDDSHVTHGILFEGVDVFDQQTDGISIFKNGIHQNLDPDSPLEQTEKEKLSPLFEKVLRELDLAQDSETAQFEAGKLDRLSLNQIQQRRLMGVVVKHRNEWKKGRSEDFRSVCEVFEKYVHKIKKCRKINENRFALNEIQDNYGNRQQFIYDNNTQNLPKAIIDGNGRIFQLHFTHIDTINDWRLSAVSWLKQPLEEIDLNALSATAPTEQSEERQILVSYGYNDQGDLIEVRNSQNEIVRTFTYQNHIMTRHTDSAGLVSEYEYSDYRPQGKVLRNKTNLGEDWRFAYFPTYTTVTDNLNRTETYYFDEHQELTKQVFADGSAIELERDNLGRILSQTDRAGNSTYFEYTHQGQVSKITRPDNVMVHSLYDNNGNLVAQTDANGIMNRFEYNEQGNLIRQLNALEQETTFDYNDKGLLTSVKDPLGNSTQFDYNANNQLCQTVDCSGNKTNFDYNEWGQLTKQTDPLGNSTSYEYDGNHNLIATILPDNSKNQYEYDKANRLIRHIDPKGNKTQYQYSLDSLPTQRTNALGQTFQYRYDNARRLTALINENQAVYQFYYNELDQLTQENGFDDKVTTYQYNPNGELVKQFEYGILTTNKPNPQPLRVTEFKRNQLGQLLEQHIQQGERHLHTRYGYDKAGNLTTVESGQHQLHFSYDKIGRMIKQSARNHHQTQTLKYEYDANGNRTKLTLPNSERLSYLYYGTGHLTAIKFNEQLITEIERDHLHREISRTQGTLISQYQLDPVGRLISQQTQNEIGSFAPKINRTYGYDKLGNLVTTETKHQLTPPEINQYIYDELGRIAKADKEIFNFDPAHNIIDKTDEIVKNNRVSSFDGIKYEYDTFGNTIRIQESETEYQLLSYDLQNQLIRAEIYSRYHKPEVWEYGYDPLGRRISKTQVRSENKKFLTTEFVWDGSHLVQEIDHKTDRTYNYIYSHPNSYEPLAQVYTENGEQVVNYFHCDQIGVPREMTDSQGNIIWRGNYYAWGQLKPNRENHTAHQPFRLQNQYFDEETGLHYNFFRYYDPILGRFINQDPIGLAGGENLYRLGDNVQNWRDPLGLYTEIIIWEPVGWGASSFGHVSSNVNGTNYSWGPKGWDTVKSANTYANKQTEFRSGVGIIMDLTKEQEDKLEQCYKRERSSYNFAINNCGDPHEECLAEVLGKRITYSMRPVPIGNELHMSEYSKGKVIYKGPDRHWYQSNPISSMSK
ncbi:RHS repeat domain-containing protein [Actinobacillus vicugnae]|uniref:RHS repeat domain-containing protein n=1 Tax=Actinobacillus vicugnae TaxID=2573093 RepID=UPI001242CFBF|nr:RHS repeat domain-containing protein [Actinobacillus vicugnae]